MVIHVVWGAADGETPLSALDRALARADIHNYNLVRLSSVIPPGEPVVESGELPETWSVGDFVGVVLAERRSTTPGETIATGIGWAEAAEGGVFYEASGTSGASVEREIRDGLEEAMRLRDWDWEGELTTRVVTHETAEVGAVQVCAVFPPAYL